MDTMLAVADLHSAVTFIMKLNQLT